MVYSNLEIVNGNLPVLNFQDNGEVYRIAVSHIREAIEGRNIGFKIKNMCDIPADRIPELVQAGIEIYNIPEVREAEEAIDFSDYDSTLANFHNTLAKQAH